jgi:hypothetical protein
MKAQHVVILSALVGTALGCGISWGYYRESPALFVTAPAVAGPKAMPAARPKVAVDSHFHNFRDVEHNVKVSHIFKLSNVGTLPLELEPGTTTCSRCTIATLEKNVVAPGETVDVTIEYTPTQSQPVFRQHATIKTNDPEQKLVELNIEGTVSSRLRVLPETLVLSRISAKEAKSADLRVVDFGSDQMKVARYEFLVPEGGEFFEAEILPMSSEDVAAADAKSGQRVRVTVKPGLPVGAIRQTIRLFVALPEEEVDRVFEIPIEGTVDSDISLVGRGWNSLYNRLMIGEVRSNQGVKRELYLMLRGPRRSETTVEPASVNPPWLKVELGEPRQLSAGENGQGGVTQIPLTIEIPPGVPAANFLGAGDAKPAQIVLKTNNPDVPQIHMEVQFVILK